MAGVVTVRRTLLLAGLVVVLGGLGVAWLASQPGESTLCTLAGSLDPGGAATAEEARTRFAHEHQLDIDVDRPDELSRSDDRETAIYHLDGPERGPTDPSHTYYRQLVAERDDAGWRIVDANRCERW